MINYETFLPYIAPAIQQKAKTSDSLTEAEIKATVAIAFKEAVINVAQDTGGYTARVPLHLYQGVKDYPIDLPSNISFDKVRQVLENHAKWPTATVIEDGYVKLPCCAEQTINNAFTLEVAGTPNITSDDCSYDDDFINKYFDSILAYMRYTLSMQQARQWGSLGHSDRLQQAYRKSMKRHKNRAFSGTIKIINERLTDASNKGTCHIC